MKKLFSFTLLAFSLENLLTASASSFKHFYQPKETNLSLIFTFIKIWINRSCAKLHI